MQGFSFGFWDKSKPPQPEREWIFGARGNASIIVLHMPVSARPETETETVFRVRTNRSP